MEMKRFIAFWTVGNVRIFWRLPEADGAVQPGERDSVVGQGLGLGVLGLGQGELGVGELEDRADARVEPALREAEVLLGGGGGALRGLDALVGLDDVVDRLLDLAGNVELTGLHAGLGSLEVGARFAVPRDAVAAVVQRPVQREVQLPDLVHVRPLGAVEPAAGDVREEVAEGPAQPRIVGLGVEPRLAVLGALAERVLGEPSAVEGDGLVEEVVLDLQRRGGRQTHGRRQRDAGEPLRVTRADQVDLALATSTSARATSDFGRVPTSKKPRADRRFSSARSTACWLTWMRRTAQLMLVYDSFTVCVTSWRCSSVSSRATSASLRAASVDAKFFPKSKRICDSDTRATVLVVQVTTVLTG